MATTGVREVPLATRPFDLLVDDVTEESWQRLMQARAEAAAMLAGRTVWTVNSTAVGGGVAEMQRTLFPYWTGSGLDARWLVLTAPASFFRLTKRLHNMLHGDPATARLGIRARGLYERVSADAGAELAARVKPGDVVILHDPQTAGLVRSVRRAGAACIWRCHLGTGDAAEPVEEAWTFLLPYLEEAHRYVFTRPEFVPRQLDSERVRVLWPAIDPRSPKNQAMAPPVAHAILHHCGLARWPEAWRRPQTALRNVPLAWGGSRIVQRRCSVLREDRRAVLDDDRLVVALSRWDRLKDPLGILHAFAEHASDPAVRLVLAGPPGTSVADDPEGSAVLRAVRAAWAALPRDARRRIDIAIFPMVDLDENGLIVNALQRSADVIVKKSLQEGFGLGVTEALWKTRPVVATRVGGQAEQIADHGSALVVDDPADLARFSAAVAHALADPVDAFSAAAEGHERVRRRYLADRHFVDWIALMSGLLDPDPQDPDDPPDPPDADSRATGEWAVLGSNQ